ncbi:MAG: GNAT family protein [Bacteroidota bacterium]
MLKGENVFLRAVEPADATALMLWENNPEHWKVSDTDCPFSLQGIMQLIEQQRDFRGTGQMRLLICLQGTNEAIGTIDLYDADFKNENVSVGILIGDSANRSKGFAQEALVLMIQYLKEMFNFHNVHCSIHADNHASIQLFEKAGFIKVGERKEWFKWKQERVDEFNYMLCLKK